MKTSTILNHGTQIHTLYANDSSYSILDKDVSSIIYYSDDSGYSYFIVTLINNRHYTYLVIPEDKSTGFSLVNETIFDKKGT